jgi:hypothetical protein
MNILDLSAKKIADVYNNRLQIEIFFKWLIKNPMIKTFCGTRPKKRFHPDLGGNNRIPSIVDYDSLSWVSNHSY